MHSQTQLTTTDGHRIAKRLFNHWKHKFEVEETEIYSKILMPTATVTLTAQQEYLEVIIENQQDDVERLEQVVIDHLNRMAQQEFAANWTHQE